MTDNKELFAAMAKAFPEIEGAIKDKANPAFKGTKYADLSSVMDAIKPALVNHALWLRQVSHDCTGGVCVETLVCHSSGQELSFGKLSVPASKQDAQGYGSALTYARRYSLMTAFGVCPEDDDGNQAASSVQRPAPVVDIGPSIDDAQWATIVTMLQAAGVTTAQLCASEKVESFSQIPASRYDAIVKKLQLTIDKKAKEGTE
jgi:ERF superfamily